MKNKIKFDGIEYDIIYKDKENDNNMGRVEYRKAIFRLMKENRQVLL